MIIFNIGIPKVLKAPVLDPYGFVPETITGVFFLKRSSDGYFWNGTAWVAAYVEVDVTEGVYDADIGEFTYAWTPAAYGQYSFGLKLTDPLYYKLIEVTVEQIQFYEAEE